MLPDPVPVSITKIFTSPWGTREPITIPDQCKLELYWELMPGESQQDIEREFFEWFDAMLASAPHLFPARPVVEFPIRWLPGSAIPASDPLVTALSGCAESVLHQAPPVVGIEGPCDMFVFHQFGIPAVLWGPRGGNTHAADEYVELDSVVAAAKVLLLFVCDWCGVADMIRAAALTMLLACAAAAQVYSPKVLLKDQPDASDLHALAQGIYAQAGAHTPRERAEAVWRFFLTDGRFVKPGFWYHIAGWAYEEPLGEVLDPEKLLEQLWIRSVLPDRAACSRPCGEPADSRMRASGSSRATPSPRSSTTARITTTIPT